MICIETYTKIAHLLLKTPYCRSPQIKVHTLLSALTIKSTKTKHQFSYGRYSPFKCSGHKKQSTACILVLCINVREENVTMATMNVFMPMETRRRDVKTRHSEVKWWCGLSIHRLKLA